MAVGVAAYCLWRQTDYSEQWIKDCFHGNVDGSGCRVPFDPHLFTGASITCP